MRHRKKTDKLGRTTSHRAAVIANVLTSLVRHERVRTTLRLAKSVQRYADKLITLAKRNTLHARRQAISALRPSGPDQKAAVRKLFAELGPRYAERQGGYTRIVKLPPRRGDAAPMAILEFVGAQVVVREKRQKEEAGLQVETEVVGGELETVAPPAGAVSEEKKKAEAVAETAVETKAEAQVGSKEEAREEPKAEGKEAPKGKDRKGGLGRFFKGLLGKDKDSHEQ